MKTKTKIFKAVSAMLGTVMAIAPCSLLLSGCKGKKTDTLIIMTQELNGLFNPFFSTAGTDMDVVGQTQIGMLSTDENGGIAYGDDEAVVVKDYQQSYDSASDTTNYLFVLKNGITFSDGVPLTMNDVLFNMYVYLDPAYTGSTTMYSTDIVGLQQYRTQKSVSGDGSQEDEQVTNDASNRASDRINELINVFTTTGKQPSGAYEASEAEMKEAISTWTPSVGYTNAIGETDVEKARAQLKEDYEQTLTTFREELTTDYASAKDAFVDDPYKATGEFDEVTSFMYMEGYVTLTYARGADGKYDKSKIEKVERNYSQSVVKDQETAISYVYDSKISTELHYILTYWATASTLTTEYIAKAKEVILHENLDGADTLPYPNITGIKSLAHEGKADTVSVNGTTYKLASSHNADGTVVNSDEYDVLSITINGVDPKAIWNFGFTVAPYHYYSDPAKYPVDIKNNQFGVEWSTFDFMKKVIQGDNSYGASKNKIPLGAGPYVASDINNGDSPAENAFNKNNVVYYKSNENFLLGEPKIKKMRYQIVSSSNALGVLESGSVHFVEPQFTMENQATLNSLKSKGFESLSSWQLGYGYIGINAGKVPSLYLRRAIMSAMDTSLALNYYSAGTAVNIAWPMSVVSWAYPRLSGTSYNGKYPTENMETNNGHDYTQFTTDAAAIEKIKSYMALAGASEGDSRLKLTFTIAGSNLTEHPTYLTFKKAAELLNSCGWDIEVLPDTNALTKLSTGSLTVWAAAWGSTIDPDMYQVYHKNSSATSVYAWGYREILAGKSAYPEENRILNVLSEKIDAARETDDQSVRTGLYREAMSYVLDLAVEMPCYQRQVLYAYNSNVIDKNSLPEEINPYTSPLAKIWEIELVK